MGINVNFNPTTGIVQTLASTDGVVSFEGPVTLGSTASGVAPYKLSTTAVTSNTTLTVSQAGVITVSGSTAAAVTVTLPSVSSAVGSNFIIRTLSGHAHIVSASAEAGSNIGGTVAYASGSKYTFGGNIGSSVSLQCDGNKWIMIGFTNTGSLGT